MKTAISMLTWQNRDMRADMAKMKKENRDLRADMAKNEKRKPGFAC